MSAPPSSDVRDLLALHLVPGLGPRLTTALLQRFGSAGAVLQATAEQLQEVPHIGAKIAHGLRQSMQRVDVNAELALMEKMNVRLLVRGQDGFPKSLEEIPDPPHLLYVRGVLQEGDSKAVWFDGNYSEYEADRIGLVDEWLGLDVSLAASKVGGFWAFPIQTVSQSEGGFELVHVVRFQPTGRRTLTHRLRYEFDGRFLNTYGYQAAAKDVVRIVVRSL